MINIFKKNILKIRILRSLFLTEKNLSHKVSVYKKIKFLLKGFNSDKIIIYDFYNKSCVQ